MDEQNSAKQSGADLEIPRNLVDDLAAIYDRPVAIPQEIDAGIAKAAWRHFAHERQRWVPSIRWIAPLAAAAVVALMIMRIDRERTQPATAPSQAPMKAARWVVSGDVDGDGRFDIVDALALAQELEAGQALDMRWDANGDGTVDGRDVDALGKNAVALY
jgi:hypothetical protein